MSVVTCTPAGVGADGRGTAQASVLQQAFREPFRRCGRKTARWWNCPPPMSTPSSGASCARPKRTSPTTPALVPSAPSVPGLATAPSQTPRRRGQGLLRSRRHRRPRQRQGRPRAPRPLSLQGAHLRVPTAPPGRLETTAGTRTRPSAGGNTSPILSAYRSGRGWTGRRRTNAPSGLTCRGARVGRDARCGGRTSTTSRRRRGWRSGATPSPAGCSRQRRRRRNWCWTSQRTPSLRHRAGRVPRGRKPGPPATRNPAPLGRRQASRRRSFASAFLTRSPVCRFVLPQLQLA
jgi:hypothetical protein